MPLPTFKPMNGRPDRMRLNCETPEAQSVSGTRGGLKKLDANQIEAIWDEVQLHTRMTFRWTPAKAD
jgi:hypothetical protein